MCIKRQSLKTPIFRSCTASPQACAILARMGPGVLPVVPLNRCRVLCTPLPRRGLQQGFTDLGGGVWLSRKAEVPLFELECAGSR